ncbi:MAG TPA: hypothetical protein VFQ70_04615 [Candidatus Saccharimonadaceae bacterium]|nr:hypothetical protein [Candidatus Saccharimonadaceae bacterium]
MVAVVVVALVGGSAAAYSLWYEAPSKVLADAAVNLVSAKSMTYTGSLSTKSSGTALSVTMNGASSGQVASLNLDATISSGSTKFNVPISLVGNAQEFYFKLSNLTALESQFINPYLSMPGGASIADQAKIDVFMKQIDGTWYSVTQSDLGSTSHNEQTGQCVQNVINSVRTNKSTQNEIMNVYRTHPLFTISKSLGSQNGSLGYVVKPASSANTKAFFQALETTSAYKALTKCDSSYASFLSAQDSTTSPTQDVPSITVWVSRWSHQLTKITMSDTTGGNDVAMTFEPKVGAQADVTIPKNAKSIKDLQSQIESLFESLGAGDMTGFSVDANGYTEVTPQNQAQIEAQAQAEFQQKQAEAKALQTSN